MTDNTRVTEATCALCGIYLSAHRRCPVTASCPHCLAEAGHRCVKPDGTEMPIGTHARRKWAVGDAK